ncbi:MAG: hypothetical protein ABUT39_19435 [Acidobacteriota bacterium]
MKKCALFAVAVLCCALAASADPAPAATEQPRTVTLEEIFSPSAGPVAPISLTGCYISKQCVCGGGYVEIDCSGEVSCTEQVRSVTCDGVKTYCPPIGSCPP